MIVTGHKYSLTRGFKNMSIFLSASPCMLGLAAYDYVKYSTAKYIRPVMFYLCR
jgi:hypothetical protein